MKKNLVYRRPFLHITNLDSLANPAAGEALTQAEPAGNALAVSVQYSMLDVRCWTFICFFVFVAGF
jgi:hypothetical protein